MTVKIGKRIKALRTRDNITQDKLAEALGVTSQAISKWENETGYPDIEYIAPIANFFNVTIDELFGHHKAEKERKIKEYCDTYDTWERSWEPVEDRIDLMRQALAEYPAEEKLLVRLAGALWHKWCDGDFDGYSLVDGKSILDVNKWKANDGWKEAAKIMEELLATSVDDAIRSECRSNLIRLYGRIGEKERVYHLAEYCPNCKDYNLYAAFDGIYDDEARVSSQNLLLYSLFLLRTHLPKQTKDLVLKSKAYEMLLDIHKFVFDDENYEFYHVKLEEMYISYADTLLDQDRIDEALSALTKAYEHAKQFDVYLDKIRKEGEVAYTSTFTNRTKDVSANVYATKALPELLEYTLLDKRDTFYKKLGSDPRYTELIDQIKRDLEAY